MSELKAHRQYHSTEGGSAKQILEAVTSHLVIRRAFERQTAECTAIDSALALIRPIYRSAVRHDQFRNIYRKLMMAT